VSISLPEDLSAHAVAGFHQLLIKGWYRVSHKYFGLISQEDLFGKRITGTPANFGLQLLGTCTLGTPESIE
jgi:hypothetical protein